MSEMTTSSKALIRRPSTADLPEILEVLERDGGVIIDGMFAPEVIDAIRAAAIDRAESVTPGTATQGMGEAGAAFVGANTVRFSSLGLLTPAFFTMLDNPLFKAIADAVLLPSCGSYWVNTGQVMFIGPGEPAQALHRDANNWWEYMKATWPNSPEVTISAMIGLDEVTEELGATRVVPGSHRWETLERFDQADSVPAELGPGDALVYSGKVLHGGGANTTDRWRRAMHLSFVAGWLTPEEASPLDYTSEELAEQSTRVQQLLGHRSYSALPHPGGGLWLKDVRAIEDQPDWATVQSALE
jgi:ectoine hydroxylase-related dioxygenase (phytanoyl-CoA dioxygenase family)